jgi:pyrroline-5-carboxylate reductase
VRIGWLGVGHLALYCVPPLARRFTVTLSPRGASASQRLAAERGLAIAADNAALVAGSDLVFLAPRPAHAVAAAAGLPWREDQIVVSLVAGLPMAALAAAVAPARLCRAMPVLAARWGESPTLLLPDLPAAREALAPLGPVLAPADEAAFETAATAAVFYSWLMRLQSDLADSLAAGGLPAEQARLLTAQTFRAVGTVGREDLGQSLPDIVAALCSPGSYSRKGLERLEAADAFAPWQAATRHILALLGGKS